MNYNLHPLKLYRANRVLDFGDRWLTRIGEELLLPDSQPVRDLVKLGAIEEVVQVRSQELGVRSEMLDRAFARSEAEEALLARIFKKSKTVGLKGRLFAWIKKFMRQ